MSLTASMAAMSISDPAETTFSVGVLPATAAVQAPATAIEQVTRVSEPPLLDLIRTVFRDNEYPLALPAEDFLFIIHTYCPQYTEAFTAAAHNGLPGVVFEKYGAVTKVCLADPLPPSQLHRLVKTITTSPYCFIPHNGGGKEQCILAEQVGGSLRAMYRLSHEHRPMYRLEDRDHHPLIDAFYTDDGKVYTLTTSDVDEITAYLDEADSAAGTQVYRLDAVKGLVLREDRVEGVVAAMADLEMHDSGPAMASSITKDTEISSCSRVGRSDEIDQ